MITLAVPTDAPAVAGPPQGHWSHADWEGLPEDGNRYEVINGVLYMSTAPSSFHQWIVKQLVRYVGIPAEEQRLALVCFSPIGVLMPGCDPVQPDFVVVLAARTAIFRERRIMGVPDVLVEILSPSNAAYDEDVKLRAYAAAGVPEYLVINPRTRTLSHYLLVTAGTYGPPRVLGQTDTLTLQCLPVISVLVGLLFADAPDTTL